MTEQVIKVLLIDDDEDDFVLTRELFTLIKSGHYVLDWASSYEEGLRIATCQEHDVCLVDFSLGLHNGVDLITAARQARITMPMILLTGSGSHDLDLAAMRAGATDYLIKNETSPSRLERTIRYAVQLSLERRRTELELVSFAEKHAAVAEIGRRALVGGELKDLFEEATRIVARTLGVAYSRLLELTPDGSSLVSRGGVVWQDDYTTDDAAPWEGTDSQAGFTLLANQTVVVTDLKEETRFTDVLLIEHGVRSGISVVIQGPDSPYGVLAAHDTTLREFARDDVNFMNTVANVMAEAIARSNAEDKLKTSEARFRRIIESNVFGIFFSDTSGKISSANDAFLAMVGYDRSDLANGRVDWTVLSPPEYADVDAKAMEQIQTQGVCDTYEKELLRKDGSRVSILISVATFDGTDAGGVVFVLDISDRKRAEESLKLSEAWLDAIFDASRDGIAVEENNIVVYANKSLAHLYGYESEEVIGMHVSDFRSPEDNQRMLDFTLQRVAGADAPTLYDFKGLRKDSSVFDAEASVSSFQSDGRTFIVSTLRDISGRHQAEQALRESNEKFHQLADNISDAFWIRSADMRQLHYVSPSFEQIWGRSVESLYAAPHLWTDFIVPEDRERVQAAFAELINQGQGLDVEYRIARPDGNIRWVRVRGFPVRDDTNQIIRHTGIVTDITERTLAEQEVSHVNEARARLILELESEQQRLVDIFTNAPAFIASLRGPDHVFELANSKYYDLVGPRVVIGRNVRDVFPDLEGQGFLEHLDHVYQTGVPFIGEEMPVTLKDGNNVDQLRYANFVYHPLRDVEGNVSGIICHGVDVTDHVLSRRQLQESEEQLRQSQKLESVGMLAGGIAHDFNNLLTVILGHSDLVRSRLKAADPVVRNIDEIHKAAARAAGLTHQLLAFSRKQILQPKVLDLNAVIPGIVDMIQRLVGEDIQLMVHPGEGLGLVKADPGQIEQVIINLVMNARDAMPRGGSITIETTNTYLNEEDSRKHAGMISGWHVSLSITDTGEGMDQDTAAHIFEPFFTTKEQGKGTGLGLATVYGIVKQSGGCISLSSEVDHGTTFEICLPKVGDQIVADAEVASGTKMAAASETVLLAEDDEMVRRLARESLESCGYKVLEAANGSEALLLSDEYEGTIDLLLTDVIMPQMSGRDLAEQLFRTRPDTRVLYMSGYTDHAIVHHGVLDGDIALLQKPFTPSSLALKVGAVLHRGIETAGSSELIDRNESTCTPTLSLV